MKLTLTPSIDLLEASLEIAVNNAAVFGRRKTAASQARAKECLLAAKSHRAAIKKLKEA